MKIIMIQKVTTVIPTIMTIIKFLVMIIHAFYNHE